MMANALTYRVQKTSKGWSLTSIMPGWITPLGNYKKRSQAVTVARLLAGRTGKVEVVE